MDYKDSLNLPKTEFSMKANLAQREPEILKFWEEIGLYQKTLEKNKGKKSYILHDGPPYANGDIHVGHTFNKVLKDLIVKFHSMQGKYAPYVPGWDCHGQPIEHNVEKSLKGEKRFADRNEIRKLSRDYALKYVDRQRDEFKRLGVMGDWDNPYLTLDKSYEATIVKVFGVLYEEGLVYKGRKPIHWCYRCKTALAEAEIEYENEKSPSIYIKFPIVAPDSEPRTPNLLVWTTTPWTLPANVAVAVDPDGKYVLAEAKGEKYIFLADLLEDLSARLEMKFKVEKEFRGEELIGLKAKHPLFDKESIVIEADFISHDQGTGLVHIAPGHGQEDYLAGVRNNLPMPMPVNEDGVFTEEAGKYKGLHIDKANKEITKDLEKKNILLKLEFIEHSYPHCWRCKEPVIFRATAQWFIAVDKKIKSRESGVESRKGVKNKTLREKALEEVAKVDWTPGWSRNRIESMLQERPDWCISRQRNWGVPLPVLYCEDCKEAIVTPETIKNIEEIFLKEGADSWFTKEATYFIPKGFKCKCGCSANFSKDESILDVWFESGVSSMAVLQTREDLSWPADLYVEGSDQHRGWFQLSLLPSIGYEGKAPYRGVLTHGFTVDEDGRKMSKSLGNVIDPLKVIEMSGADILRLWVVSSDYSTDIAISNEIIKRVSEAYRRIRNTARFLLGNTFDFNPEKEAVDYKDLLDIDKWALMRLQMLIKDVTLAYEQSKFHQVYHKIYNFAVVDMSAFYLDVLKDRLYTMAKDSKERKSAQTVLYEILTTIITLLAPVISFTAEEIWQSLNHKPTESVILADWPEYNEELIDKELDERFSILSDVRDEVLKALEEARVKKIIGNALEAYVTLKADGKIKELLEKNKKFLPDLFIVSEVNIEGNLRNSKIKQESDKFKNLVIGVSKTKSLKCERCWRYLPEVGTVKELPGVCKRCAEVIEKSRH